MVDVVVASDNVVVVGGPSSVNVALDIGPQGQRGSQIYTGLGAPTDVFLPDVQINDLYINLKQSDFEYLYLYKYSSVNGVSVWSKVLRLVPNTVLNNPVVRFINGQAHSIFVTETGPIVIKGLYFPLASLFPDGTLTISINDLNVQHNIISESDVSSGLSLDKIDTAFEVEVLQQNGSYASISYDFGTYLIRAFMYAKENDTAITGFRTVHLLVTVGGKDLNAKYFDATDVDNEEDLIAIPLHGMSDENYVIYLNNGNDSISGLTNESMYRVILVDSNTISLASLVSPTVAINLDASASSGTHTLLKVANA